MRKQVPLILIFLVILLTDSYSQIDSIRLNLSIGYTRNFQIPSFIENSYSINPEIQFEGHITNSELNWLLYLSYWDDNATDPRTRITDIDVFYTFNDLSVGTRLYLVLLNSSQCSFLELSMCVGISHSFIRGTNILEISRDFPKDIKLEFNAADFGGKILVPIGKRIGVFSEYILKVHLAKRIYINEIKRNSFKLGIAYYF